jgi:hypothetical protein
VLAAAGTAATAASLGSDVGAASMMTCSHAGKHARAPRWRQVVRGLLDGRERPEALALVAR